MEKSKLCQLCERHCSLEDPQCGRGRIYAEGHINSGKKYLDYNVLDENNKLIINLRDLGHMLHYLFEGKGSQKRILIILYETGGMTQRELTERLGIKPGSASEVIGKLERAGLIERSISSEDRRTVDIKLTEAGYAQADEAAKQREIRHQEMFGCLTQEEKTSLIVLLEKLRNDWNGRYRGTLDTGRHRHHEGYTPHGRHGRFRKLDE